MNDKVIEELQWEIRTIMDTYSGSMSDEIFSELETFEQETIFKIIKKYENATIESAIHGTEVDNMTLDDAISHLDDLLKKERQWIGCEECRQEHIILRRWLMELRERKAIDKRFFSNYSECVNFKDKDGKCTECIIFDEKHEYKGTPTKLYTALEWIVNDAGKILVGIGLATLVIYLVTAMIWGI